jgi:hypothetical protein
MDELQKTNMVQSKNVDADELSMSTFISVDKNKVITKTVCTMPHMTLIISNRSDKMSAQIHEKLELFKHVQQV